MGTHVTEQSWFSRIGGAVKGILFGGILTVVSVPILFWNEGRAVRTAKGLKEGAKVVVDIDSGSVDSANEGKFIHTSGEAQTTDILRDAEFAVEYQGVRLNRHVETYQWVEHEHTEKKKKMGGGTTTVTTYTYDKQWRSEIIDSTRFDEAAAHPNPVDVLFSDRSEQAKNVTLGAFRLPDSLIGMIDGTETINLSEANLPQHVVDAAHIRNDGPNGSPRIYVSRRQIDRKSRAQQPASSQPSAQPDDATSGQDEAESDQKSQADPAPADKEVDELIKGVADDTDGDDADADEGAVDELIRGVADEPSESDAEVEELIRGVADDAPKSDEPDADAANAPSEEEAVPLVTEIGDTRIWFTATPATTVSLLSQQSGDSFQPFKTHFDTTIHVLREGTFSAAEMIAQEEANNRMLTWVLRGVGAFVMFIGLMLVLRPMVVLADVLPIFGDLVGFGSVLIAGLLTIAGSLTVIGIAWVFYRPLLGITLLVLAAGALFLIVRRGGSKKHDQPETLTDRDLA